MGHALSALALTLGAWSFQERDPLWDELLRTWGDEFRAVQAARADPERRAGADAEFERLVRKLQTSFRELGVALYKKALPLGDDATLPDEERIAWLTVAEDAARFAGDEVDSARAGQKLSRLLWSAGRRREAVARLEGTLRATRRPDLRAHLLQDLAESQRKLGANARSLELLDELEALLEADPALASMGPKLDGIRSYVYIDLGLTDVAARTVQRRLAEAEERGASAPRELEEARVIHAHWLLAVGDQETLEESARRYLGEAGVAQPPTLENAGWHVFLGKAEIVLERLDAGRERRGAERLRRVLQLGLEPQTETGVRLALAQAELAAGRLDEGARELALARASLGSPDDAIVIAESDLGLELATLEAWLLLERRAPADALAAARERLVATHDTLLEIWAQAPEREGGVSPLLYSTRRAPVGEYTRLCLALEGAGRGAELGLERLLSIETMGTLARRHGFQAPALRRIRDELLDEGRGILVYLPTQRGSHVFALDREGLLHAELVPGDRIEEVRRRYVGLLAAGIDALADPARRAWVLETERRLASELAELLFPPPVRRRLETWSGVTIVGTDTLVGMPFEWLPLDRDPHLGARLAVDLLPSLVLGAGWARRPRAGRADGDLLLIGAPRPAAAVRERWPELEPLSLPDETVARIAAPYPRERVLVLRGAEATRRRLFGLDLAGIGVLQFLAHGVHDQDRERPLALVLSEDAEDPGLLRSEDVDGLEAPRLVILSSCRSGVGPVRKGDPAVTDMGGAWLAAGAQAVVVTRMDLGWDDAVRMSTTLHRELGRGRSPAEALRATRADLVAAVGGEAPFRGGLASVVGLGHLPLSEPPDEGAAGEQVVVAVLALLVGLGLGVWLGRARR